MTEHTNNGQTDPEEPAANSALQGARQSYNTFNKLVSIRKEDSVVVMGAKILLRLIGIGIMILLSPFLLLGLMIAFAAVL